MAARGRGRGRGDSRSFNREQLAALGVGVGGGEFVPGQVTQPPPLYPLIDRKPVPLNQSKELEYLLILKQDLIHHMQLSPSFIKMSSIKSKDLNPELDKLVSQLPNAKEKYDWNLFPNELRPKLLAKRTKIKVKQEVDVTERLEKLEKLEEKLDDTAQEIKLEPVDEIENQEDAEMVEEEQDEEMDDGTDYANNYFDNGEDYEDEDDNLDDGPIY